MRETAGRDAGPRRGDRGGPTPRATPRPSRVRGQRAAWRAAWVAAFLLALAAGGRSSGPAAAGPALPQGLAAGADPGGARAEADAVEPPIGGYRLDAVLGGREAEPEPGRYASVADVSSLPNGRRYVLDPRLGALHVIRADGLPLALLPLPEPPSGAGWLPLRLDAGPAGGLALLWRDEAGDASRIERLGEAAESLGAFEVATRYNDLALAPDGTILATRARPLAAPTPGRDDPPPLGGLDRYAPDGARLQRQEGAPLALPVGVDVGRDGAVHVINWRPSPSGVPRPGPEPTARPAAAPGRAAPAAEDEPVGGDEAILRFDAGLRFLGATPFYNASDLAVGRQGVVVSRQLEIFDLAAPERPLWSGPTDALQLAYFGRALSLDLPARGGLTAGLEHCLFRGLLRFEGSLGALSDARMQGRMGRPALGGPWIPRRLARQGAELWVLQDRFSYAGAARLGGAWGEEPQTVQRWDAENRLLGQLGVCGDDAAWFERRNDLRRSLDLAATAEEILLTRHDLLEARAGREDEPFARWALWPDLVGAADAPAPGRDPDPDPSELRDATSRSVALDALGDAWIVLDAGRRRLVGRLGGLAGSEAEGEADDGVASWSLAELDAGGLFTDLALAPGPDGAHTLWLADAGRARLLRLALDDDEVRLAGEIALGVAPRRIAGADDGTVLVLGAEGWLRAFAPDGTELRRARLPGAGAAPPFEPTDLVAGPEGRVDVSYLRRGPAEDDERWPLLEAGVWRLAPAPGAAPPAPPRGQQGCLATGDKEAAPGRLRLGQALTVTLRVDALCPQRRAPMRIVLLLDRSRSMARDGALERAKERILALLAELGPEDRVALVGFGDPAGAERLAGLGTPPAELARVLSGLRPDGDSRAIPGFEAAEALLVEAGPAPGGTQDVLLLLTDGDLTDWPEAAAARVRADGVALRVVVLPHPSFTPGRRGALAQLTEARTDVWVAPEPAEVAARLGALGGAARATPALATLALEDEIPANMRYVNNSAEPPADWDPASRRLRWTLRGPALPLRLRYRLLPRETGTHPTNVRAEARWRDALGHEGSQILPVPRVEVWDLTSLEERAYLPLSLRDACLAETPLDVVLALDASRSMDGAMPGGGSKLEAARRAAEAFLDALRPGLDRAALVSFDEEARLLAGLGAPGEDARAALARLRSAPGTRLDRGLGLARAQLDAARPSAGRALVLLSDGRASGGEAAARDAAAALRAGGVRVETVGLGPDADEAQLRALAGAPSRYRRLDDAAALVELYALLAGALRCRGSG